MYRSIASIIGPVILTATVVAALVAPHSAFAQSKPLVILRVATSTSGLDFAPIFIAQRKGYFKEEGIDFQHTLLRGGAAAMAALTSGDVQFNASAASDVLLAWARGERVMALGVFPAALGWNIATSNKWLESRSLTKAQVAKMTVAQKIQALKGTTIGAATTGGGPAQVVRYMLRQSNVKPDADVRFAAVGFGPARVNALKNGQVDMIVGGIPDTEQPELEGWGATFIRLGQEVDIFKDYPHEAMLALETYVKANPDVTRAFLRALARGNNFIIDNPTESDELLVKQFRKIDPNVLKAVAGRSRPTFRRNMRSTKAGWENLHKVFLGAGLLKSELNMAEGEIWTNQYLPQ